MEDRGTENYCSEGRRKILCGEGEIKCTSRRQEKRDCYMGTVKEITAWRHEKKLVHGDREKNVARRHEKINLIPGGRRK